MIKTNEPVAWAVTPTGKDEQIDCEFVYPSAATAGDVALGCDGVVVPLYREPKPALTASERKAIEKLLRLLREDYFAGRSYHSVEIAAVIDGILERQGGER